MLASNLLDSSTGKCILVYNKNKQKYYIHTFFKYKYSLGRKSVKLISLVKNDIILVSIMQTLIIVHVPGTSLDYQWLRNSEILKVFLHTLKSAVTPLLLSISCLYRFSISKYLINRKKFIQCIMPYSI